MLQTISTSDLIAVPPLETFRAGEYLPAPALKEIAEDLLSSNPPFADFQNISIDYLWKKEGGTSKGKAALAKIMKVSGVWTHYTDAEFIIWIAADHLLRRFEGTPQAPRRAVEALLFGQLSYLFYDPEKDEASLTGPDFIGFYHELARYSDEILDLRKVKETVQQLPLFGVRGEA